ncbi:hypothetical protein EDB65_102509 [Vibrio crassostreae]|nr:hypothetical protein EDB65_102509 [Vibrio crassostreae]
MGKMSLTYACDQTPPETSSKADVLVEGLANGC